MESDTALDPVVQIRNISVLSDATLDEETLTAATQKVFDHFEVIGRRDNYLVEEFASALEIELRELGIKFSHLSVKEEKFNPALN